MTYSLTARLPGAASILEGSERAGRGPAGDPWRGRGGPRTRPHEGPSLDDSDRPCGGNVAGEMPASVRFCPRPGGRYVRDCPLVTATVRV